MLVQVYYCNHRRWWVVALEWAFSLNPFLPLPFTPRNVLFMKVSLLCDHSSFDGRHWIVHDCQVHFYFLPGIALLFAKLRILPGVWRIFESLKVQHWVFMNLRPGLSTRVSMLNICKVLRFEKAQVRSGKVTILKGLTMTFATLVTCHCLNNSAVTSMWGRLDMVESIIIIAAVSWHHYCATEVFTDFDAIWIFVSAQRSILLCCECFGDCGYDNP